MREAEKLKANEIKDHAAWLKEHASTIELPGGKALNVVLSESFQAAATACAGLAAEIAAELRKRGEIDAARGAQLVEDAIRVKK